MRRRPSRKLFVESLEDRRMLAANLHAGVLSIEGTNRNDTILISLDGSNLTVQFNRETHSFTASGVSSISVDGRKGSDRIEIGGGITLSATILGGDGNDRLIGGGGNDSLEGGKGNDRISGGGGNDVISGGAGNDRLFGDAGADAIHGDAGNDWLSGGDGDDDLFGDAGEDKLSGDAGNDHLVGGKGNDRLNGGDGDDELDGEGGNDQARGGSGNDIVQGDNGNDVLDGDDGNDFLSGGNHHDVLRGGSGNDVLSGGAGQDRLNGGDGEDFLDGGEGRDVERGGQSIDVDSALVAQLSASGGASADATFEFETDDNGPEMSLRIEVDGAASNSSLLVTIGGVLVGTIVTDASGDGELAFSSSPDGDELPFPAGLIVTEGTTISIGASLSGAFQRRP